MITEQCREGFWRRHALKLRQLATGGGASIFVSSIASNALRIVSAVTLTRLLDTTQYGVVGIISSTAAVFGLLSDIGTQPFVIRHPEGADPRFLDEIWTLRLLRAIVLTLLMAALALPIATLLNKPMLAPALAVWSVSFLIDGLSSMAFATAIRERQLWLLSSTELAGSAVQLIVAIPLAFLLRSYWALVAAMLLGSAFKSHLSFRLFAHSRRRLSFNRDRAAEMWKFARLIAPSSYLTLLILQADKLILAALLPLATFGLYAIATTLVAAPTALGWNYTRRVLYPVYAETAREAPERLSTVFYRQRRWVALSFTFLVGAMGGGASLVVAVLYDPRYAGSASMLALLAISAALTLVNQSADEMLLAAGRLRATLGANITRVSWLAIGTTVALTLGKPMLVIATFGIVEVVAMLFYWVSLTRLGIFKFREEALVLASGTAGGLSGAGVAWAVLTVFPSL